MRPYQRLTSKTFFGNDWFGNVENIPDAKIRNKMKRKYGNKRRILIQLFSITSKKAVRRKAKEEIEKLRSDEFRL